MNRPEVLAFLSNVEKCYPTQKWKKEGVHIWPIIRIDLAMSLCLKENPKEKFIEKNNSIRLSLVDKLKALKLVCFSFFSNKTDAIFIGSKNYRTKIGEVWINKFFDVFATILHSKKKSIVIAELDDKEPIEYYNSNYLYFLNSLKWIYFRIYRYTKKIKGENCLEGFSDFVTQSFQILEHDSKESLENTIRKHVNRVLWEANYFYWVLKVIKPKIVFQLNYYNSQLLGLNIACNKLNIPNVDIQHGGIGNLHFAYAGWAVLPLNGYEALPKYFWNWSSEESDLINSWGKLTNYHTAINFGNPWIYSFKNDSIYTEFFGNLVCDLPKNIILVSLQSIKFKELNRLASIIKKTHKDLNWAFRVHPTHIDSIPEIQLQLDSYGIKGYYLLKETSQLPLPLILKNTAVNITEFSGVCLEAAEFGVRTIITCPYGVEIYPHLFRERMAFRGFLSEETDFINLIYKLKDEIMESNYSQAKGKDYFIEIFDQFNKQNL